MGKKGNCGDSWSVKSLIKEQRTVGIGDGQWAWAMGDMQWAMSNVNGQYAMGKKGDCADSWSVESATKQAGRYLLPDKIVSHVLFTPSSSHIPLKLIGVKWCVLNIYSSGNIEERIPVQSLNQRARQELTVMLRLKHNNSRSKSAFSVIHLTAFY